MSAGIEEYRSRLREALTTINQLKAKLESLTQVRSEPIAIVGMACRFPGGGDTPERFFRTLVDGVDAVTEVPATRWALSPVSDNPMTRAIRWGAFLKDIDQFDADFFGISPREAKRLDPQQRLLLELAWEAFENAALVPARLVGSRTGVFLGLMTNDYAFVDANAGRAQQDAYSTTGNGHCFPAGRISYTFGLQGPSIVVDTACSSSLVALHLANQSLRSGESDLALVGGVNLMLSPEVTTQFSRTRAFSPDGRCKSFDAAANGYVRGEGCGVILVKRLGDAIRNGDRIHAVIRGSAVNQDGRSTGLTTPNVLAQEALIRSALLNAGLTAADIGYIEAHGTGTPLGDPIEIDALLAALGAPRSSGSTCLIGAVKTNIGHLEAAAGMAGLIKTIMIFQQSVIPRLANFRTQNPRIDFHGSSLALTLENTRWVGTDHPRRAGISSFGMSGTNAHVILEEAPLAKSSLTTCENSAYLLPLSAQSPQGLTALVQSYAQWLSQRESIPIQDIAYTASVGRTHHEFRLAAVARTNEQLVGLLNSVARNERPKSVLQGRTNPVGSPKVAFICSGQGSQWLGMGKQLLAKESVFRDTLAACDNAIRAECGVSILAELEADEGSSRIGEIDIVQPILFAISVALAALWRSWGILPDCIVGHSMGEVAAAHVAGMLSLQDASKIICRRSHLLKKISGRGAMGLVELPMAEAEAAIADYKTSLAVAAGNGPRSTVLSGDPQAIEHVLTALEQRGIFCRRIKVDVASHSPQVDPLHDELLDALVGLSPNAGTVPMRSTVLGRPVQGPELNANYWWDNVRQPVHFGNVIQALLLDGYRLFVELSPHPILLSAVEENLMTVEGTGVTIASMRRSTDERQTLLEALGTLHVQGYPIDWEKVYPQKRPIVSPPTYPWQRQRYWVDRPATNTQPSLVAAGQQMLSHPFLGRATDVSTLPNTWLWNRVLSLQTAPFLRDHRIGNIAVFPGAGYIEAVLGAARQIADVDHFVIENLSLVRPFEIQEDHAYFIEVSLTLIETHIYSFRISSKETLGHNANSAWTLHATGQIQILGDIVPRPSVTNIADLRRQVGPAMSVDEFEQMQASLGLQLGPSFQGIREIYASPETALALIESRSTAPERDLYFADPMQLDMALRIAIVPSYNRQTMHIRVLSGIKRLQFWGGTGDALWSHAQVDADEHARIQLLDRNGELLATIEGIETHALRTPVEAPAVPSHFLFLQEWTPAERPLAAPRKIGRWLLLFDDELFGEQTRQLLTAHGGDVKLILTHSNGTSSSNSTFDVLDAVRFGEILQNAFGAGDVEGVVYSCNTPPAFDTDIGQTTTAMSRALGGAIHLIQGITRLALRNIPHICFAVRGSQSIPDSSNAVFFEHSPVWGLGRLLAHEYPEITCTRIDLDPNPSSKDAESLVAELLLRDQKDEIALRAALRFTGRIGRPRVRASDFVDIPIQHDATYLLTSSGAAEALAGAQALATAGARHIVVMCSEEIAPDDAASIRLENADIVIKCADVRLAEQLDIILREMDGNERPLRGVLHFASSFEAQALRLLPMEVAVQNISGLLSASLNLHHRTSQHSLDFFVLCSTITGMFGESEHWIDAVVTAFFDSLAAYRREKQWPGTSIAWGPLASTIQHSSPNAPTARLGWRALTIPHVSKALLHALTANWIAVGVADVALQQWLELHPQIAGASRFDALVAEAQSVRNIQSDQQNPLLERLKGASAADRLLMLETHIRQVLASILRMEPDRIDRLSPLRALGIDSLMSLELRNQLESDLRTGLSATIVWAHPSVAAMAEHLLTKVVTVEFMETPGASPPISDVKTETTPPGSTTDDEFLQSFDKSMQRISSRRKK